jgi:hypothetical protein
LISHNLSTVSSQYGTTKVKSFAAR